MHSALITTRRHPVSKTGEQTASADLELNSAQKTAVFAAERPTLVLAGAGSGKTRVLTYRIARLIESGADPGQILAVTFTNKAADEMRQRLSSMLDASDVRKLMISTFHGFGSWFLRTFGGMNFRIIDDDDQKKILYTIFQDLSLNLEDKDKAVSLIRRVLGKVKDCQKGLEDTIKENVRNPDEKKPVFDAINAYENKLKGERLVDFGGLLAEPVRMLQENATLLKDLRDRFWYVLVDEFQDVNPSQYELVKKLCKPDRPVFVVGDDDQTIYGWRGSDVGTIFRFEQNFRQAQVFKLEQNYRSTKLILDVANAVIEKNRTRRGKTLWTNNNEGRPVLVIAAENKNDEADIIAGIIRSMREDGQSLREIAVLYRYNWQSQALEESLRRGGIPYRIIGGMRFYLRKEIQDFLAYLRFAVNPSDTLSFHRLTQSPRRGIGEKTLEELTTLKQALNVDYFELINNADALRGFKGGAKKILALGNVLQRINDALSDPLPLSKRLHNILGITGLRDMYVQDDEDGRLDNLNEFIFAVKGWESFQPGMELQECLDHATLMSLEDETETAGKYVSLMTLHKSKGLEFSSVFLVGVNDGLLPFWKGDPEEERRLFYVGITRAKERLFVSHYHGETGGKPSRFLRDIPEELKASYLPKVLVPG